QQWYETINLEQAERQRLDNDQAARAAALSTAEQNLVERRREWVQAQESRRLEIEGLEKRVQHLRAQLPSGPVNTSQAVPQRIVVHPDVPVALHKLAGDVADQRWRLLDQWQRLLEVHNLWHNERGDIVRALET